MTKNVLFYMQILLMFQCIKELTINQLIILKLMPIIRIILTLVQNRVLAKYARHLQF